MGPLLTQSAGLRIGAFDDKAELQRFELPTSKQSFAEVFREYLESVVLSSYAVR